MGEDCPVTQVGEHGVDERRSQVGGMKWQTDMCVQREDGMQGIEWTMEPTVEQKGLVEREWV